MVNQAHFPVTNQQRRPTMPADINHIKPQYARSENGAKNRSAEQRIAQANLIKQEVEGLSRFEGPPIRKVS